MGMQGSTEEGMDQHGLTQRVFSLFNSLSVPWNTSRKKHQFGAGLSLMPPWHLINPFFKTEIGSQA